VKPKRNNKIIMLRNVMKEHSDGSSYCCNKGSVSLRERNISQINYNI
jgi:hypothetical protein